MKYPIIALAAIALALTITGCSQVPPRYVGVPVPLTQQDIIEMTGLEATDEEIMAEIDNSGTVFNLTVGDIAKLNEAGVSEGVVNFMLETPHRRVRVIERVRYVPSYYDPWGYDPWYDPYYRPRTRFHFGIGTYHRW